MSVIDDDDNHDDDGDDYDNGDDDEDDMQTIIIFEFSDQTLLFCIYCVYIQLNLTRKNYM